MEKAWQNRLRRGVQALSVRTTVVPKEKFTAPTPGLENVTFSRGTKRDSERFKNTPKNLAQHIRTWHVYGATNAAKAMQDMAEPVFTHPICSPRKYYEFRIDQQISGREPMVETSDQFTDGQLNTKLVDDAECKLDLDLFMVVQKKYKKDQDTWIENRARTYNLVLQHCLPDVKAELKNQSTWTAGKDDQNVVTLLIMIRDITYNTRDSKQGVMAIIEYADEMNTTAQKS